MAAELKLPVSDVRIRLATEDDAPAIRKCLAAAFAPYRTEYSPGAFADTVPDADGIHTRLQQMHVLVAIAGGVVVGTIAGAVCDGREGHLRGMAVLPEWQGTGLAAQLLVEIEQWLRSRGCARITLDTTIPLKAAVKFYEKNGYRRSGKISDFFGMPLLEYVKEL
jgi:GNAT superfamily N-acetyltransferase